MKVEITGIDTGKTATAEIVDRYDCIVTVREARYNVIVKEIGDDVWHAVDEDGKHVHVATDVWSAKTHWRKIMSCE